MNCSPFRLPSVSVLAILGFLLVAPAVTGAAPAAIAFSQSAASVDAYDFVEVTAAVTSPDVADPFADVTLTGLFETADSGKKWAVEGFCDAEDGRGDRDCLGVYLVGVRHRLRGRHVHAVGAQA